MSQTKDVFMKENHNHGNYDNDKHAHHHSHNHHHHDHEHEHDHHHGDEYQNEFDLYPEQFISMREREGMKGKILDIREEWEQEQIRIKGSMSFPMQKLIRSVAELNNDETYYILCSQGIRSSFAGRYLISQGFSHIYSIQTGIYGIYEYAKDNKIKLDWLEVAAGWDLTIQ